MAKPAKKAVAVASSKKPAAESKKAATLDVTTALPFDLEAMLNNALKKKAVISKEMMQEMEQAEEEEVVATTKKSSKKAAVAASPAKESKKAVTAAPAKGGKKAAVATTKDQKKGAVSKAAAKKEVVEVQAVEEASASDEEEENLEDESNTAIIQRTILGLSSNEARAQRKANKDVDQAAAYKTTMLEDPLAATLGLSDYSLHTMASSAGGKRQREEGDDFVASIARQKGDSEYVAQDALLNSAHAYFTEINKDEKKRNRMAMARIQEMKRINESGGDKDGFKFVLPKSVKTFARTMNVKGSKPRESAVDYSNVDPDDLQSQFLTKADPGTSVGADADRELLQNARKIKKKEVMLDDFYQHQKAKKWAKNAENFLLKGRANKNMFMKRQQSQRSTKKM